MTNIMMPQCFVTMLCPLGCRAEPVEKWHEVAAFKAF
jgi:hypothetical protein